MTALTLPTWLDADNIRTVLLLAMVALLVWGYLVARFARVLGARVATGALVLVLVVVLWGQRSSLQDCIDTADCECAILGLEVQLPSALDRARCG